MLFASGFFFSSYIFNLGIPEIIVALGAAIFIPFYLIFWLIQVLYDKAPEITLAIVATIIVIIFGIFIGSYIQKLIKERRLKILLLLGLVYIFLVFVMFYLTLPRGHPPALCSFGAFICLDHRVLPTEINLELKNMMGYNISYMSINAENCGSIETNDIFLNYASKIFTIKCSSKLKGSEYRGRFWLTYYMNGTNYSEYGKIFSRIQK